MKTAIKQLFRNEAVVTTDLQNELLIFDPVTKFAHVLNATGKLIWNGISSLIDPEVIADTLKMLPGASALTINEEVTEFIDKLDEAGLLVSGMPSNASIFVINVDSPCPYTAPKIDTYSEEFLREHLKDVSFTTFHDDTYSDLSRP
jgi:seryl-tRNA(Sec) selenium transferase